MAKKTKKKKPATPHKKATHERPLKNRPMDDGPEPPETEQTERDEAGESTGEETEEESLVTVTTPKKKRGRQARLTGMEDAEIEGLEALAEEYVSVRDQRQQLTLEEVRLKKEILDAMHANKKETYNHGGCEIRVVVEKEKVKVKMVKETEPDAGE